MKVGIIVSKGGHNIKDDSQFRYFDTSTPLLKLYLSGGGAQTYTNLASPTTFIIPHGLGYIPMFFLFADRIPNTNTNSVRKIVMNVDTGLANAQALWTCYADNQNINVTVNESNVAFPLNGTFNYNYFIYYDRVG